MNFHLSSRLRLYITVFAVLNILALIVFPLPHNGLLRPARASKAGEVGPARVNAEAIPASQAVTSVQFEKNLGQFDERVRFAAKSAGSMVFLTPGEAVYVLPMPEKGDKASADQPGFAEGSEPPEATSRFFALRMKYRGANPEPLFSTGPATETRSNYFNGGRPDRWRSDIPHFNQIGLEDLYNGIDLVWRGREYGATQYDFVVHPGAAPSDIVLEFEGADSLEIADDGALLIKTAAGTIRHDKPFSYQEIDGIRQEVTSGFILEGSTVKFGVGDYDASREIVIDPTVSLANLAFSTFLGSFEDDLANDIAVDANGCVYVTGRTTSVAFPTTAGTIDTTANGINDVFVTKFNPSGTGIIFSTYLGGTTFDEGTGIAVDNAGNVFVSGIAGFAFPVTTGAFDETFNGGSDVFVAKLNHNGSALIYSTYLGASQADSSNDLAIDAAGNAYIVVRTADTVIDYPTTAGAFDTTHNGSDDVAITKLNASGSTLVYSTFLGGSSADIGRSIAVNGAGEVYVTGSTTDDATDMQTTPGAYDTTHNGATDFFVARFSADGSALIFSTFIGGPGIDNAAALAIDNAGNAYVAGSVNAGFPTTAGVVDTASAGSGEIGVSKISANGSTLVYSTFLGGTQGESANGIAVDITGNAYITGENFGGDYPTTTGAFDTTHNGSNDALLTVLNLNATAILYSTYVGGGGADVANDIAVDWAGNVYIAGRTAFDAAPFPTSPEAFQTFNSGGIDAFVTKFGDFVIGGKVIDTAGEPLPNVMVSMSGQVSGSVITGADGRFGFVNTVRGEAHSVAAMRPGFSFNPAIFNIAALNNNRELVFIGAVGSPTGGAGGTFRVDSLSVSKSENGAEVTLNVRRTGTLSSQTPVTVDFTTSSGTAIAGQDFQNVTGTLTYNAFEELRSITIPLVNDSLLEPRESFFVTLSNPTNNSDIEPGRESATVHILDEDISAGSLLISEFRLRGKNGPRDEYIKLFNPNDFDITVNAADGSEGLSLVRANGPAITEIATIPVLVTIPARGHYLFTNNSPSGGFSLIDYPTGTGSTTAVGDRTFSADIPDNSDLALLATADPDRFSPDQLIDAAGFGNSVWTSEGKFLTAISPENSEFGFVRRLTQAGLQDTGNNAFDFILLDGSVRAFESVFGKLYSTLGAPAPGTTESLRLMAPASVTIEEVLSPVWNEAPVPNGTFGTLTIYRKITNETSEPILALRLRAVDFPTIGSLSRIRTSARADFRLLNSVDEGNKIKGVTLAAERLQPAGGGINSTLTVDAVAPATPLAPGESVIVAIRFGVMRYGRMNFQAAAEALQ